MAYKQSPFSFYDKDGDPRKSKKSFTKKVETRGEGKFEKKREKLPKVEKKEFKELPPARAKKEKIKADYSNLSPMNMNGDPKKKAKKVNHMRNKTAEEKAHNKHARKTEGSLVRQSLRRRFGSNKPK